MILTSYGMLKRRNAGLPGTIIAYGGGYRTLRSVDGATFLEIFDPSQPDFNNVLDAAYSISLNTLVVADSGATGSVYSQTYGSTYLPVTGTLGEGMAWSSTLGMFISTYGTRKPSYSYDGEVWTNFDSVILFSQAAKSIIWDSENNVFVGVCLSSGGSTPSFYSYDGLNWTVNSSGPVGQWVDVAYGNGIYVAANLAGPNAARFMTSTDLTNWTYQSGPGSGYIAEAITYSPTLNLFCAVGRNATNGGIMTSTTGLVGSWTLIPGFPIDFKDVIWSTTYSSFYAVGNKSTVDVQNIYRSTDGVAWTAIGPTGNGLPEENWKTIVELS